YGTLQQPVVLPDYLKGQFALLGRDFPAYRVFIIVFSAVMVGLLWFGVERTRWGAMVRATVDNRAMAQSVGIDTKRLFTLTFALGSGLAGLGGGLGAEIIAIQPSYPFENLVYFLVVVSVGGLGRLRAPYVAGILAAKAGIGDSMVQLVAAAAAGALLGISTGAIILRTKALTLLMLTLAITSVLLEIANKATALTGGADGLSGVVVAPILGLFRFDIFGKTAYLYCLLVLFLGWWLVRRLIYSPFGTSLTGVRENSLRMHGIGGPVYWRLVLVYTLSATIAGVAGGLITQTNQFVGLNVLSFESAGELLVMLIL